jgi:hypothetical protein
MLPLVVYDNRCYLCIKFARMVNFFAKDRLCLVGHYSGLGEELRPILGSDALEMFWFIDGEMAYGGRAALLPLIKVILSGSDHKFKNSAGFEVCDTGCKTAKAVFVRSASLLTSSRKIPIHQTL